MSDARFCIMIPAVRFDKVSKRYGALTVLRELTLEVAPGEIVTTIGPSGSGKTTVLRTLMTLESIDDGVIYVEGMPLSHINSSEGKFIPAPEKHQRAIRRKIGMVFQNFNL